jgi:hypothetical protein
MARVSEQVGRRKLGSDQPAVTARTEPTCTERQDRSLPQQAPARPKPHRNIKPRPHPRPPTRRQPPRSSRSPTPRLRPSRPQRLALASRPSQHQRLATRRIAAPMARARTDRIRIRRARVTRVGQVGSTQRSDPAPNLSAGQITARTLTKAHNVDAWTASARFRGDRVLQRKTERCLTPAEGCPGRRS